MRSSLNKPPALHGAIAHELKINPYLRSDQAELVDTALQLDLTSVDAIDVFTVIRQWKNNF